MMNADPIRTPKPSEEGYILIWVIFLLAVFTLALSIAAPIVAKQIQLDRERETMQRGKQYIRSVQLYYRKFHAFPPSRDALVKTNEIRFLRKKYIDPTTGKDDWKPIRFGQNKAPTAMGFFGQPMAGSASTIAGTGPSGGNGINGTSPGGGPGSAFGPSSMFGSSSSGTAPGAAGSAAGTPGTAGSSSTDTGLSGQTFGGAGIIGFEPAAARQSIMIYKKKNKYNEWEFVYDPLNDQRMQVGNTGNIGQPVSNTTNQVGSPGFNSPSNGGPGAGGSGAGGPGSNTPPGPGSVPETTPPNPQVQ